MHFWKRELYVHCAKKIFSYDPVFILMFLKLKLALKYFMLDGVIILYSLKDFLHEHWTSRLTETLQQSDVQFLSLKWMLLL